MSCFLSYSKTRVKSESLFCVYWVICFFCCYSLFSRCLLVNCHRICDDIVVRYRVPGILLFRGQEPRPSGAYRQTNHTMTLDNFFWLVLFWKNVSARSVMFLIQWVWCHRHLRLTLGSFRKSECLWRHVCCRANCWLVDWPLCEWNSSFIFV